jgi:hypothetical protein
MKLYVASSWRNEIYPEVVRRLRACDHEVYDFREPVPGQRGFHWSAISSGWLHWEPKVFRDALKHPLAEEGYASDWKAMQWAEGAVLVLPSGRSAHIEAGYFIGAKKPLFVLLAHQEPELMYKLTDHERIATSIEELLVKVRECQ